MAVTISFSETTFLLKSAPNKDSEGKFKSFTDLNLPNRERRPAKTLLVRIKPREAKYKTFATLDPTDASEINCFQLIPETFVPVTTVLLANSNTGTFAALIDFERLISTPNKEASSKYLVASGSSKITKSSPRIS